MSPRFLALVLAIVFLSRVPDAAPDIDVSIAALEFAQPVEVMNAAPLPTDTGASGTLVHPSKTSPTH